jgi:hypothetical protein
VYGCGHVKTAINMRNTFRAGGVMGSWEVGGFGKKSKFRVHHQLTDIIVERKKIRTCFCLSYNVTNKQLFSNILRRDLV